MKKVYFVRHGETEGNVNKFFQTADTQLTDKGLSGAKAVAQRFKHLEVDVILASPFKRAQQTAQEISSLLNLSVETVDSLHEMNQAISIRGKDWVSPEGQEYHALHKENFFNPDWNYNGAENHGHLVKRIESALELIENHTAENIVVVTHGYFLGLLISFLLLNKNPDSDLNKTVFGKLHILSNVAITEFIFDKNEWKLFTFNDHAHFAE